MNHTLSINAPLSERLHFNPSSVSTEEVIDALKAYEAILDAINGSALDTMIEASDDPLEVSNEINASVDRMIERAINSCADNPYRDFFDACVDSLNGHWPGAGIETRELTQAILDAIAKGDTD